MTENIVLEGETLGILEENKENENEGGESSEIEEIRLPIANKPPPKPRVEPRTPEHYELIDKILLYKKTFVVECANIPTDNFDKLSIAELHGRIELCKSAAADRPNSQMHKMLFKTALSFGELYVAPKLKMNLRGLTNTAMQDEDLLKCLDEIVLSYDMSTRHISPETRFVMSLSMLAIKVNAHNKQLEKLAEKPMELPAQTEKFEDL